MSIKDGHEVHLRTVEREFALVLEVHGDPAPDVGLDLPEAPVGPVGIADEHAGFKKGVHIVHRHLCRSLETV